MESDPLFDPVVAICPHVPSSDAEMWAEYRRCVSLCESNGYRYVESYGENGQWRDIQAELNADVVFFLNSWERTLPRYHLANWHDVLPCYVPYFFVMNTLYKGNYGKPFHAFLWAYFVETLQHKELAKQHGIIGDENVQVTGYPGLDGFISPISITKDPWIQLNGVTKRRIIYAPHHTISTDDAGLAYSTFEKYADAFVALASKYVDVCQFAFKPHPLLRDKLNSHPKWGKQRTDQYWEFWRNSPNCQLEEGAYEGLFLNSDALIHDCNSFLAEYLCTRKPTLFLECDAELDLRINKIGREMKRVHYLGKDWSDVEAFVNGVVVQGNDAMKPERDRVVDEWFCSSGPSLPSGRIYEFLCNRLARQHACITNAHNH